MMHIVVRLISQTKSDMVRLSPTDSLSPHSTTVCDRKTPVSCKNKMFCIFLHLNLYSYKNMVIPCV